MGKDGGWRGGCYRPRTVFTFQRLIGGIIGAPVVLICSSALTGAFPWDLHSYHHQLPALRLGEVSLNISQSGGLWVNNISYQRCC